MKTTIDVNDVFNYFGVNMMNSTIVRHSNPICVVSLGLAYTAIEVRILGSSAQAVWSQVGARRAGNPHPSVKDMARILSACI